MASDCALAASLDAALAWAIASVGSVGDSYDNAMAEAFNSLFKPELVRNRGPWAGINDLEIAVDDSNTDIVGDRFDAGIRTGEAGQAVPTVEQVLGRPALTWRDWARENAAAFDDHSEAQEPAPEPQPAAEVAPGNRTTVPIVPAGSTGAPAGEGFQQTDSPNGVKTPQQIYDQLQRMRVARVRQSWEDRRSTTHPTELTLLVTGTGPVLERRQHPCDRQVVA